MKRVYPTRNSTHADQGISFVWGLSLGKKNWLLNCFQSSLDKLLCVTVSFFLSWRFFSSPYYRWPNISLRGWYRNPFPLVPGKVTAISSVSPSWIYLNCSSSLLLKCFSPFRSCVPCVTVSAKGCNQLPFAVDTGRGSEEERSYWSASRGQGCGEGECASLSSFHCLVCLPLLTNLCYCVEKPFNNSQQNWINGNTKMKRTWLKKKLYAHRCLDIYIVDTQLFLDGGTCLRLFSSSRDSINFIVFNPHCILLKWELFSSLYKWENWTRRLREEWFVVKDHIARGRATVQTVCPVLLFTISHAAERYKHTGYWHGTQTFKLGQLFSIKRAVRLLLLFWDFFFFAL